MDEDLCCQMLSFLVLREVKPGGLEDPQMQTNEGVSEEAVHSASNW